MDKNERCTRLMKCLNFANLNRVLISFMRAVVLILNTFTAWLCTLVSGVK